MYCFSASFCFICLQHYPKSELLDINKNRIKDTKLVDVLQFCGIDSNYCDDSYHVYMCEKCVKRVEPFYAFKQECATNFTKLKGYATQLKSNANIAFHANLKVILTDPKYGECNEPIEYMDVSQFLEAQIQMDEATQQIEEQVEEPELKEIFNNETPQPFTNVQLYEISKFVYDNHFLHSETDYNEVIEVASSPESFNDIPQNSSGSFNDVVMTSSGVPKPQCKICLKTYVSQTQLTFHSFLHNLFTFSDTEQTKSMKYYCVLCSLHITGLPDIKKHLLKHTSDKVFSCGHCEKEFISYVDYNRHFNQFPSHKPFACKICDRHFLTEYKLNVHTAGKHMLKCMLCSTCFKTKPELKAHMMAEHNNKYCYICASTYTSNNALKKHLFDNHFELQTVDVDGKSHYKCKKCSKLFQTKYSLNDHLGGKCVVVD